MADRILHFTGTIEKADDEQRMVYGYASTEAVDSQGEVVKIDALKAALNDYMKFANIREMHQPSAVGKAKEAQIDEKGLYIAAKIVDDKAWQKVKEGVYGAFSIGGRVKTMVDNEITGLALTEISLVDRPANPEAMIDVWKAEGIEPVEKREFSEEERKTMAANGQAMPDGSFPIANEEDLHNAIRAYGRAKNKVAAKKHIIARAKEMGMESALPDDWKTEKKADMPEMKKSLYEADYLVDLACNLNGYMMSQAYQGENIDALKSALQTIKQAAVAELSEDEKYPELESAVEMAEKTLSLKKEETAKEEPAKEEAKPAEEKVEEKEEAKEEPKEEKPAEEKKEEVPAKEEEKEEAKETAEKTEMEKIEEALTAFKMPTEEQCEFLIKSMGEEVTERTMGMLKHQLATRIVEAIEKQHKETVEKDAAEVAKKAQEQGKDIKETTKHEFDNIKLLVNKLEKALNEQAMNAHSETEVAAPKASEQSPKSPAEKINAILAMLQEVAADVAAQNQGNGLSAKDKKNGEDGYREGSDGNNGGHVDPNAVVDDPSKAHGTEAGAAQPGKGKADMPEMTKAEVTKLNEELQILKKEIIELQKQPMPIKAYAGFATVEKAEKTDSENAKTELEKAEKRADEIHAEFTKGNTDPALAKEANELSVKIMRLRREVPQA